MKQLQQLQQEIGEWSESTFGNNDANLSKATGFPMGSSNALTGITEEVGELNHATICYHQGRRGYDPSTPEGRAKYKADRDDSIADLVIFLCDYCYREKTDLLALVNQTWDKVVSKRTIANWEQLSHDSNTTSDGATISEVLMREEANEGLPLDRRGEGWTFGIPTHVGLIEYYLFDRTEMKYVLRTTNYPPAERAGDWVSKVWWRPKPEANIPQPGDPYPEAISQNGNGFSEPPEVVEKNSRPCSKCGRRIHDSNSVGLCSACYTPAVL